MCHCINTLIIRKLEKKKLLMKIRVRDIINYMKLAWQVMKGTPSIRTLFLCVSANSPISLLCFLLSPPPFCTCQEGCHQTLVFSLFMHIFIRQSSP